MNEDDISVKINLSEILKYLEYLEENIDDICCIGCALFDIKERLYYNIC